MSSWREDKKDRKRKGTERQSRKRKADGEEVAATPTHAPCPTYLRTPLQCPLRLCPLFDGSPLLRLPLLLRQDPNRDASPAVKAQHVFRADGRVAGYRRDEIQRECTKDGEVELDRKTIAGSENCRHDLVDGGGLESEGRKEGRQQGSEEEERKTGPS